MLFNTAVSRKAESVLAEQSQRTDVNMDALRAMKQLALDARMALQAGDLDRFGCLLHETWMLKRNLASRITSPEIDGYYTRARAAGAQGGKITGAGGGGYLLLFCPPEKQEAVRKEMAGLDELYINPERDGSKVIFNNRR
jgi:D-glycero-alpha-D-manno-heptose-7-phosphate kinase